MNGRTTGGDSFVAVAPPDDLAESLARVTGALPGGGEDRPGQLVMARAVAGAIAQGRHLVVQAGTGTGKSLAYLLPALRSGRRVVVATATKALQDQLATKELPFLAAHMGDGPRFSFAVLKGRSNYLCRQRATELAGAPVEGGPADPSLFGGGTDEDAGPGEGESATAVEAVATSSGLGAQLRELLAWAVDSPTGDRADLPFEPHPRAWSAVSVSARECPGAFRCPSGSRCFAEWARTRAASADVVVVNTHLYATHVATEGAVVPEHDVLILDEAHAAEDIMTAGLGIELTGGRLRAVAATGRALVEDDDRALADAVSEVADHLDAALRPLVGRRLTLAHVTGTGTADPQAELRRVLDLARGRVGALGAALHKTTGQPRLLDDLPGPVAADGAEAAARRTRLLLATGHLADDLAGLVQDNDDHVTWVEASGPRGSTLTLRRVPVDIGPVLAERLWPQVTSVLTSATVPPLVKQRLGLPGDTPELDVGSPFPYQDSALLYCASHLPDRRRPEAEGALHDELAALIGAAGGRALVLFTSWRAMRVAHEALLPLLPYRLLAQNDMPKVTLLDAFASDESSCLFATMSFWQGVDVPGTTLSLVAIDRLPFPRPDDPLLEARRERAGSNSFRVVDLPRAATLLAQGAGRLIRSSTDAGVVAVLDSRLATAGYRRTMLEALPPMRFTTHHAEAVAFLRRVTGGARAGQ
jgi:ATP-dependent DNA helicase DinG